MKQIELKIKEQPDCRVTALLHNPISGRSMQKRDYPAIIICPGGGYEFVSDREADPVAAPFFAAGYNTFILWYSVGNDARNYRPLCQLAAAIRTIRERAEELVTLPDRIAVCGFSAGAHLAASLGVLYDRPEFLTAFGGAGHLRPDAMILGYPVITADEFAHRGSIERVSGAKPGTDAYRRFGLEQYVSGKTPPAFLWHTAGDASVPVENSLKMAEALSANRVPFELHILPEGGHGMSVCTQEVGTPSVYNARWVDWCIRWLDTVFEAEKE